MGDQTRTKFKHRGQNFYTFRLRNQIKTKPTTSQKKKKKQISLFLQIKLLIILMIFEINHCHLNGLKAKCERENKVTR